MLNSIVFLGVVVFVISLLLQKDMQVRTPLAEPGTVLPEIVDSLISVVGENRSEERIAVILVFQDSVFERSAKFFNDLGKTNFSDKRNAVRFFVPYTSEDKREAPRVSGLGVNVFFIHDPQSVVRHTLGIRKAATVIINRQENIVVQAYPLVINHVTLSEHLKVL
jgi:hypothetical protein